MEENTNQPEEQPVLETPEEGTAPAELSAQDQANALLNELKGFGVEKPEDLQGMATASQQAGNLANQLGTARSEVEALTQQVAALSAQQAAPAQTALQTTDEYGNPTIDLSNLATKADVAKGITDGYNELVNMQRQQNTMQMQEVAEVQKHSLYPTLKEKFEQYVNNPTVQMALGSQQTSYKNEFDRFKDAYMVEALKRSKTALEAFAQGKVIPPHMEQGDTQAVILPSADDTKNKNLKKLTSKDEGWEGTNDNLLDMVKQVLPGDDPILQT